MRIRFFVFGSIIFFLMTSCGRNNTPNAGVPSAQFDSTPSPVPTATIPPTPTQDLIRQSQQAALLYSQDFEAGNTDGLYDFNPGALSIRTEADGNHVYCNKISGDQYAEFHFGAYSWSDYAVEMRVKALQFQNTPSMSPYVSIFTRFDVYKYLQYYASLNFGAGVIDLAYDDPYTSLSHHDYQPAPQPDKWYTMRLEAAGDSIKYYINNRLVAQGTDAQRSSGKAGFSISPNISVCVDDIRVWQLTKDGQIAPLPPKTNTANLSVSERLATHKFPRLVFYDADSDPSAEALSQAYFRDILVFDKESIKTDWLYFGSKGIIRSQNPNAVIMVTHSLQEFLPSDNSMLGTKFISSLLPEWIMKDIHGKPFPAFCCYNGKWSTMMNLSTDITTFIPNYLNDNVMKTGLVDGIYFDGTNETWWESQPAANRPGGPVDINHDGKADTTAEFNSAMDQGVQKILTASRNIFPAGSLIAGNGGWDGSLLMDKNATKDTIFANLLNGREVEEFLSHTNIGIDWLVSMRAYYLMQSVSVEPKTPFVAAICTGSDYNHLRYTLASALMFDGYFACTNSAGEFLQNSVRTNWWYDEYSVDLTTGKAVQSLAAKGYLGMPRGEAHAIDNTDELLSALLVNNDRKAQQMAWRRDFQNGIVLVNPSGATVSVKLGGSFRKIIGTYDPKFNDGSLVSEISLPPKSGVILLNAP